MVTLVIDAGTAVAEADMFAAVAWPVQVPHAAPYVAAGAELALPVPTISTLYPVGNGAVGAFHDTVTVVAEVVAINPLNMFGTVLTAGKAGATIDVVADAP